MEAPDKTDKGVVGIRIQGLCSIADADLAPGRLTVLIGANGSGKSNVLRALKLLPLLRTQSLQRLVGEAGGASTLLHYGPKHTPSICLELCFRHQNHHNYYRATLGFAATDGLIFLREEIANEPSAEPPHQWTSLGSGHTESRLQDVKATDNTAKTINRWLSRLTFFHFHDTSIDSALRTNARVEDNHYLRSDGSNLAAFLLRLEQSTQESDQTAWRRINRLVTRIAPSVKQLCPTLTFQRSATVRLDWIDDRDELFGVHQLSDGTLRAIALVTALAQPTDRLPWFISIDEPELGLHPAAISLLAELARSVSKNCQVIFATQSTALLDHFEPAEIVVVERDAGATQLYRRDEQELRDWLQDYSLSEVYEKGLLGGRP